MVLLPHSEEQTVLSSLLVIAPTGIYSGRVRKGIDAMVGSETEATKTKVRVILVAGENWIRSDESYRAKFVDELKEYVLATWKRIGYDIVCDVEVLPMDEEYLTGWLLKELSAFFKGSPSNADAYVDLTSAPKEWIFAAINVLNFFSKVELYYIKPLLDRQPKDYSETEIKDEGHPKPETVRVGEAREPLPHWIQPRDGEKPNFQYLLFQTIFRLGKTIALEQNLDPSKALDKVWIPIEEERGLDEYRQVLPEKFREKFLDDSTLRKSVSKFLNAVEPFRLFEVKGKSVRMTLRATMLGQTLFEGKD